MPRVDRNPADDDRRGGSGNGDRRDVRPDQVETGNPGIEQPRVTPLKVEAECEDGEDDCDTGVESEIRQDPLRRSSGQQACDHARADDARDGEEGDDPAPRYGGYWSLFRDMRGSIAPYGEPIPPTMTAAKISKMMSKPMVGLRAVPKPSRTPAVEAKEQLTTQAA